MNDKELSAAFEKAAGTGDWTPIYDECVRARAAEYRLTNKAQQLDSESGWNETQWRRERKANSELHDQLSAAGKTIAVLQNHISEAQSQIRHLQTINSRQYECGFVDGEKSGRAKFAEELARKWSAEHREQRLD